MMNAMLYGPRPFSVSLERSTRGVKEPSKRPADKASRTALEPESFFAPLPFAAEVDACRLRNVAMYPRYPITLRMTPAPIATHPAARKTGFPPGCVNQFQITLV